MEIYIKLFEVVFPVFFVVGIGYYLGKKNPKIDTKFITNFAANIGTPAKVIYAVTSTGINFEIFRDTNIIPITQIEINKKQILITLKYNTGKNQNINCHLILMPDIHKLNPYNLNFINKKMLRFSQEIGIPFFDLLHALQITDSKKLWNKYKDPHPNKYAHSIIGDAIFNYLDK